MKKSDAFEKLNRLGQSHLLERWGQLNEKQQEKLLKQIEQLDPLEFIEERKTLKEIPQEVAFASLDPFEDYEEIGSKNNSSLGKEWISQGAVGAIIIAGGQGTRLGFDGPKGMFPLLGKRTLFELLSKKILAASKEANRPLPVAIMTSPSNDRQTREFFEKQNYFGLKKEQVSFFVQSTLPFLDNVGNLFLDNDSMIAEGPDGNGGIFTHLFESGLGDLWQREGIKDLIVIPVDNPLADPFDSELVGFHKEKRSEVSTKCILKKSENEKVGVFVKHSNQVFVKEYSELADEERTARLSDGLLKHRCANTGIFCFSIDFVYRLTKESALPLHKAYKMAKNQDGTELGMAWKFERFIFDCLPFARRVSALLAPRELCFAPLKNSTGEDSIASVQAALLNFQK